MKRPPLSVNDNGIDFFSPAASCFCRAGSGVRASVQKHRHGSKWICMNTLYYAIRAPVDLDFPLVQFKEQRRSRKLSETVYFHYRI